MIGSLFSIKTDSEGESKITFAIPLSEIANVVRLNGLFQRELHIEIKDDAGHNFTREG